MACTGKEGAVSNFMIQFITKECTCSAMTLALDLEPSVENRGRFVEFLRYLADTIDEHGNDAQTVIECMDAKYGAGNVAGALN